MAVRIRLKKMGRAHRPFYRVCAFDHHAPRDGRALEELGTYDTSLHNTDARAVLDAERIDYWLSVGAQPTEKVAILIKKYGKDGTHLDRQKVALEELATPKSIPEPGAPASLPKKPEEQKPAEAAAAAADVAPADSVTTGEAGAGEAGAGEAGAGDAETPAVETADGETSDGGSEAPADEAAVEAPAVEDSATGESTAGEETPKADE